MSEYLPITPSQIVDSAVEAAEAGAAILHLHARNGEDGSPSGDPAHFRRFVLFWQSVPARSSISRLAQFDMGIEQRLAYPLQVKPEMCSLNMDQ